MGFAFRSYHERSWIGVVVGMVAGIFAGAGIGLVLFFVAGYFSMPPVSFLSTWMPIVRRLANPVPLTPTASDDFYAAAFHSAKDISVPASARILLVPHHLIAGREIASLLSSVPAPRRVILLAPDHLGVGRTPVTIGDAPLAFDKTSVNPDSRLSASLALAVSPSSTKDTDAVSRELSVQALMPMLARAWPRASITPILLRIGRDADVRAPLAERIAAILRDDPHALLVATVDFSHDLPANVADFHDALALDVIQSLADLETDQVELDSAGVLAVALKTARTLGLGSVAIHDHTNSIRLAESVLSNEGTSHITASFASGNIRSQETVTALFFGDMMFDREVRNRMSRAPDPLYPFDGIVGKEERMMAGQDLVIGNLEGAIAPAAPPEKENDFAFDTSVSDLLKRVGITAVSQANNHALDQGRAGATLSREALDRAGIVSVGDQVNDDASASLRHLAVRGQDIALLAFNTTDNPLDRDMAQAALASASTSSYRIVFMHWGNEYQAKPSSAQVELAHWLIENGADAVIGSHPHWMQSVEVYRGHPIAYSLGNFIFDQDWSSETQNGLVAGLVLNPSGFKLHLFPISIIKSHPVLLTGTARQSRLDHLAEISDAGLMSQIREGVVDGSGSQ